MPKKVSVSTGFELCFPDTTWVLISTELLMPNHRHFGSSPVKKTNKQNKAKQTKKRERLRRGSNSFLLCQVSFEAHLGKPPLERW